MSTGPGDPSGSEPGGGAGEAVQQAAGQVQEKAQELAGQAQQQAQLAAGQAKNRLRQQLDERSSQAAEQINQQAGDLRAVSASLREQGKDGPAGAADRLAEYAERVGSYLRDRDSDALLADVEDFGRRRPWAVTAGGLALGFAASRFLKASSSRRYSTRHGEPAPPQTGITDRDLRDGSPGEYPPAGLGSPSGASPATPSGVSPATPGGESAPPPLFPARAPGA